MSDPADWTYESKYTILKASLELKERFRAAARAQVEEEGTTATDEKIEQIGSPRVEYPRPGGLRKGGRAHRGGRAQRRGAGHS